MALPMSRPIKLKNGVYYLQQRVPVDLVDKVGRKAIKASLRTKDPTEAKARHASKLHELNREWAYLRSEIITLSHKEVVALTKQRYSFFRDQFGDNPPILASTLNELEMRQGVGHDTSRLEVWYRRAADKILKARAIKVDIATREILLGEIHRTDLQSLEQIKRNAKGDYSADPKANRFPEWSPPKSPEADMGEASLPHLFSLWERDHLADNGASKTASDFLT